VLSFQRWFLSLKWAVFDSTHIFFWTHRQQINMAGWSKCLHIDKLEEYGIQEELFREKDSEEDDKMSCTDRNNGKFYYIVNEVLILLAIYTLHKTTVIFTYRSHNLCWETWFLVHVSAPNNKEDKELFLIFTL
jgi:hypothetical protein